MFTLFRSVAKEIFTIYSETVLYILYDRYDALILMKIIYGIVIIIAWV